MNRIEVSMAGGAEGGGPIGGVGPAGERPARSLAQRQNLRLERVVRLAAQLMGAARAGIVLLEGAELKLQAETGAAGGGDHGLCSTALAEAALRRGRAMFVADVSGDEQLRTVAGDVGFYAAAPLTDADGRVVGMLCVADPSARANVSESLRATLIDLADLAMSEIALDAEAAAAREQSRLDRDRTALALSAAGLAAYEWDLHTHPVVVSEALRVMVGWDPARGSTIDRADVLEMLHPEDRQRVAQNLRDSLASRGRYTVETRVIRPIDGRVMWIASSGALVGDGNQPHKVFGVIQDITDRKTEEDQRETLVAELDHRVKNVLAAVQSLAAQSARKASSLEGFLKTFAGRLKSMASAHQLLTATRWRGAGMHNIAAAELGGLAPGQTRWSGPDVILTPRGANAMSLALHELATNAVKFGSLSTEVGRVEVTWRRTDDGGLELLWQESHGPAVVAPTRRGFGTTLLEKVTGRELGGSVRVDYRTEGVRAVVTVGPSTFATAPTEGGARAEVSPPMLAGASFGGVSVQQPIQVRGLKVLIVEDALLLALELEAGLTEAGAEVVGSAADVGEAMRMADLPIDAAVLDANLNGASVLPVAQALAARGVPFVFATGYGDDKMLPAGFDAPVIRKPYDVTQVAAALSEVTGRTARAPA
jgi:PAS domain S-box-containing protein